MRLLVFLALLTATNSLRILSVVPTVTKSHYASTRKILLELAKRGHHVVSISPFEDKGVENFTWIPVEVSSMFEPDPEIKTELSKNLWFYNRQRRLWRIINTYTKYITAKPKLRQFIESDNSEFDLVIAEEFLQPVFFLFSYKYKCPLVLISTFGSGHYISEYLGNSLELSYVPHEFYDLFGELDFIDRVKNGISTIMDILGRRYYLLNDQEKIAKDLFGSLKNAPPLYELERNASLILLNSHYSLSVVRPYLPNMIEIGGVHIEAVKPLNKEFKDILDGAKDGAILFSLGSLLDLSAQPDEFVRDILNAFGKLKQRVLIKWNSDQKLPIEHKNLYPFKWIPQNDVLAHPNLKLLITHGGLLSSQETIYHGVPVICIPFYGDQHLNCMKSVQMGYGIQVLLAEINTQVLLESINRILSDKNYYNTVSELSRRFRDRPIAAMDLAVFWIEYCARHRGMDFIKGPKRNLYWFQYYYVDAFLMLGLALWVFTKLLNLFWKRFLSLISKKVKKN